MAKQAEGLSPNHYSIISPQIPESMIFSWNFMQMNALDYQKSASLSIYTVGGTTPLVTVALGIREEEADLSPHLGALTYDQVYEWSVRTVDLANVAVVTDRATFKYVMVESQDGLVWPLGPNAYEYIGTRQYFDEIRQNAIELLEDYGVDSAAEIAAFKLAESLFTGITVPSRTDYENIERILKVVSTKEGTYQDEVVRLVEDGLGAEDIHKIYDIFDRLTHLPPRTPDNVYLSFSEAVQLQIAQAGVSNRGEADVTIDLSWEPTELDSGNCQINFMDDLSEDIAFYRITLETGFSDYRVPQTLYYRKEDIEAENYSLNIPMTHLRFINTSTTKKTTYEMHVVTADKRGNFSPTHTELRNVADVPEGVDYYQVRAQKWDLGAQAVKKSWYDIYTGPKKAYVHNVGGNPDGTYQYAVRLFDKNGLNSSFYYIDDMIKVDPLKPPAAPKPRVKSTTISTIEFSWNAVTDAEEYEIDPLFGTAGNTTKTGLTHKLSGLSENKSYSIRVRAKNRAGVSQWVSIAGKTNAKPILETAQKAVTTRSWRTAYRVLYQNGGIANKPARYDVEKDNREVMHGEWIELRDKYESGAYVKKGTRWGNYKSLVFLDYQDWQSKLAGKEIIEVKMYIRRKSTAHGYPDDGRFLHVYTHNYASVNSLPAASTGPSIRDMHKATKLDFDRGQGQWITLPKLFGEKLRDGKMKGVAFHHPSSTRTPYSYMRLESGTFQLKIRYK